MVLSRTRLELRRGAIYGNMRVFGSCSERLIRCSLSKLGQLASDDASKFCTATSRTALRSLAGFTKLKVENPPEEAKADAVGENDNVVTFQDTVSVSDPKSDTHR